MDVSASCLREHLLDVYPLYKHNQLVTLPSSSSCGSLLQWIVKRGIVVTKIRIPPRTSQQLLEYIVSIVGKHFSHLEVLLASGNNLLTAFHLREMCRSSSRLNVIDVSSCQLMDDGAIEVLANDCNCNSLSNVRIGSCRNISALAIVSLVKKNPNIEHLDISGCRSVTDDIVEAMLKETHHLMSLSLDKCVLITDESLRIIAEKCPKVTALSLHFCDRITDTGIAILSVGCKNLQILNLSECINITDDSLVSLSQNSTSTTLRTLTLRSCLNISSSRVSNLRTCMPALNIIL